MNKLRFALVSAVVAVCTVLGLSAPAFAYPVPIVSVSARTVTGGDNILIQATVSPAVTCNWTVTFAGQSKSGTGTSFAAEFDTPEVGRTTQREARATCVYNDDELASLNRQNVRGFESIGGFEAKVVPAAIQTVFGSNTQTLLSGDDDDDSDDSDDSDDDNDGLPNTGGERLLWLVIGLLLVVGGATVIVTSRRNEDPEAQT